MSSAGAIRALKHRLDGAKVGHLGTLDPFASGLLPLCIGEATKVARYLLLEEKAYEGRIRLGWETDTLDGTGTETGAAAVTAIDDGMLDRVRATFVGPQRQTPPMYSALKNAPAGDWTLIPIAHALEGLRRMRLDGSGLAALRHGRQDVLRELPPGDDGEAALVLDDGGEVAAIVEMTPPPAGWRLVRLI